MKTKKIIAESMPLALKMVRHQLGDNAIIVNTRMIKKGGLFGLFGRQKYEVTAYAMEKNDKTQELNPVEKVKKNIEEGQVRVSVAEDSPSVLYKKPQARYQYYNQKTTESSKTASSLTKGSENEMEEVSPSAILDRRQGTNMSFHNGENERQVLDELQDMRKMMMNFMMGEKINSSLPPGLVKWVKRLNQQSVDKEIIDLIVNDLLKKYESIHEVSEENWKLEILYVIEKMITERIPETHLIHEDTHLINVIGPTGVGKTTSIAKLATEQVLKQKRRVAMITTDVYRIGAVEQLKTYAGILNVPIEVVHSANELEQSLQKLENYDLIYMDTTGRNYRDVKHRESINEYLYHPLKSDNYLVMSLTTKYEDMQVLLDEFLNSPVKKLILTKFDETTSYGTILNIAYKYPYQLAYITNGQSVPEDITTIDARLLAGYLLGEEEEHGSSAKSSRIYASI